MKIIFLLIILISVNLQANAFNGKKKEENQTQVNRLIEKGEGMLDGASDSAVLLAEQSHQIASSIGYETGVARALLLKGKALNAKEEYSDALEALKPATRFFQNQEDSHKLGQSYYEQGVSFYRTGKTDSSLSYLHKAFEIFDLQTHQADIAHTERMLALGYWRKGMYIEGLDHIQRAIGLYEELNETRYLSTSYNTKGAILWGLASYEKALEFFFEALTLNEKTGENIGQNVLLLNNIGLVYHDWDEEETAFDYFKRAEALLPESDNPVGTAYTHLNLGTYYLRKDDTEKALELLNKAKNGYAEINDINGVCLSKIRIGQCYNQNADYQQAETSLLDAIETSQESGNKHREATAFYHLAQNDLSQNRYDQALKNSLISLDIAEKGQYKDLTHTLYEQLSEIYEKMGNLALSLEMFKNGADVKDEIYNEKIAVQYNIIDLAYENQLKELENSQLKNENLLKQKTIYYQYAAVFLIISMLIATSLFALKLSKKQKELRKANQSKDKIFSIVAHDLRSPVGTLNSMVDILVEEDHGLDYREILNKYKPVIAASFNMLENLLVWAKSNLGKLETSPETLSLNKTIQESISLFSHFSQKKAVTIEFIPEHDITVWADKILLDTVIRNLLNNAIKFSRDNGKVTVKTQTRNNQAVISVSDNGVGVPREAQSFILSGNYHSEGTHREKGSGIGLMLSKDLAEINGGSLWFSSTEGEGSTFSFYVPLNKS